MRTTLAIDDDVLRAAKALARAEHRTIGAVVSALARRALTPVRPKAGTRNGLTLLPLRENAEPVTLDHVNALRDEGA